MAEASERRSLANSVDEFLILNGDPGTRDQVIQAILDRLASRGCFDPELVPALQSAILARDELGPTGIGEGVAIPHTWHAGLRRIAAALAVSHAGIDYPSLDGAPVHIVLLILTPRDKAFEPAKQEIFGLWLGRLRDPTFRASLILARSVAELQHTIGCADEAGG